MALGFSPCPAVSTRVTGTSHQTSRGFGIRSEGGTVPPSAQGREDRAEARAWAVGGSEHLAAVLPHPFLLWSPGRGLQKDAGGVGPASRNPHRSQDPGPPKGASSASPDTAWGFCCRTRDSVETGGATGEKSAKQAFENWGGFGGGPPAVSVHKAVCFRCFSVVAIIN